MSRKAKLLTFGIFLLATCAWAQEQASTGSSEQVEANKGVVTTQATVTQATTTPPQAASAQPEAAPVAQTQLQQPAAPAARVTAPQTAHPVTTAASPRTNDDVKYTLGPDDLIRITVQRHAEFSGDFPVNMEGKVQIPFVGDMDVNGLTKREAEDKVRQAIGKYVVNPDVAVTILQYRSKFYFVIGEVSAPGRYYMRSETTTIRDAVVEAGLPMTSAAMRKCRLITPSGDGRVKTKNVDIYAILYGGNLRRNLEMRSGDVLYVPSTMMTKVLRVIAPVAAPVGSAAGVSTGLEDLNTRPDPGTSRRISR